MTITKSRTVAKQTVQILAMCGNEAPVIVTEDLEKEAEKFLLKFCPEVLTKEMPTPPTPIAQIITDKLGMKVIRNVRFPKGSDIHGMLFLGKSKVRIAAGGNEHDIEIARGTVIADIGTHWANNIGCVNNTLAQLVFVYDRFAPYHHISTYGCKIKTANKYKAVECEQWSDYERIEWQAVQAAQRILMPRQTVVPFVMEKLRKLSSTMWFDIRDYESIIDSVADTYKVSRPAAKMRLIDLGFVQFKKVYSDNWDIVYFDNMSLSQAFGVYCQNDKFRTLIKTGNFRFADGKFVVNDIKYVDKNGHLTRYALNNLSECVVAFSTQTYYYRKCFCCRTDKKTGSGFAPGQLQKNGVLTR